MDDDLENFEIPPLVVDESEHDDEESSDEEEEEVVVTKKRGPNYKYSVRQVFVKKSDYDDWWRGEKQQWVLQDRRKAASEVVETWFCRYAGKYSHRQGVACMCRLRIFFPDTDESVIVKESQHEHHHDAELRALPEELKEKIREMLKNGLTAKKIHVKFTEVPTLLDIPLKTFKAAYELEKECKDGDRFYAKVAGGKYIISGSKGKHKTAAELYGSYRDFHFDISIFHSISCSPLRHKSPLGAFLRCTCKDGPKKAACSHATMVMCSFEKTLEYPAKAIEKPMEPNRKRKSEPGRPPMSQKQNRFAA
ncbi:hypothetical protein AAVH_37060, partial [Aphelenchoides avenae]